MNLKLKKNKKPLRARKKENKSSQFIKSICRMLVRGIEIIDDLLGLKI